MPAAEVASHFTRITSRPVVTNPCVVVLALAVAAVVEAQDLTSAKPPLQKLDSQLNALLATPATSPARITAPSLSHLQSLAIGSRLPVTIRASDSNEALRFLAARGLTPANVAQDVIEVYADLESLRALNDVVGVVRVDHIERATPQATSQGVLLHNAQNWHSASLAGAGVRVGVIDSGFVGFTSLMGVELPTSVVRRCYTAIGAHSTNPAACETDGNHGTAVAEALIDVAPAVQLYIANPISQLDVQDTVAWMLSQGVRVINYSQTFPWDGPGNGSSPYIDSELRTIDNAVAGGATFIAASGNHEGASWFGSFQDVNGNDVAEFGGLDDNFVDLPPFTTLRLQLRWNDSWSGPTRDLDLLLYDSVGTLVQSSLDLQSGLPGQTPRERLAYTTAAGGRFYIRVARFAGTLPTWLQLQATSQHPLGVTVSGYSIVNGAESANPGMLAVGAASWQTPSQIEPYSSRGPTPDGRVKPEIVGTDRGDSTSRGPSGFPGTSQAAPHVAGLAALVVQGFPGFSPTQVATYLKTHALPRGAVPNSVWGAGFAYLPSVFAVTVSKTGSGGGLVSSSPAGISCGTACTALFLGGATATLTATPTSGSVFVGWTGGTCVGSGVCSFNVTTPTTVNAVFEIGTCTYSIDPTAANAPAAGGAGAATVSTSMGSCGWTATSGVPWIAITSGTSGSGSGTMAYSVQANPSSRTRTGVITLAGRALSITQAGASTSFTSYLSEGATGTFFDTSLALLNPGMSPASVQLRFLTDTGATVTHLMNVPAGSRRTVNPETLPGLSSASFSTVVESNALVVTDRTMSWGGGYGSHAESAVASPSMTWYLAEGSTSGEFNLFYLLQNPSETAVQATVRYLLPSGRPPVEKTYSLRPNSRTTISVNAAGPGLSSTDVSAVITASAPIIVERAMYINKPGQPFAAGHESAGVTAPALDWFLAEGATGPFFDLFVLVANPNDTPAQVTAEYLLLGGGVITKNYAVPANGRFTIYVDGEELPAGSGLRPLTNVAVSTTIRSTNNVPVIVERAMWWPGPEITPNFWYEAHNSPGATSTGTRWGLAEGEVGGPSGLETYVLIANTSSTAGSARVTLHFEDGATAQRVYSLRPNSRTNVSAGTDFPAAAGRRFGVIVESLGDDPAQIVVERAMYSSADGIVWAAGTNSLATRLQ